MILWVILLNSLAGFFQLGLWAAGGFASFSSLGSAIIHLSVLAYGIRAVYQARKLGRL